MPKIDLINFPYKDIEERVMALSGLSVQEFKKKYFTDRESLLKDYQEALESGTLEERETARQRYDGYKAMVMGILYSPDKIN